MSKLDLDLKKFKHLKSDDKMTTLQHADGHTITLFHGGLPKDFQERLKAIPRQENPKLEESKKTPSIKKEISSDTHNMAEGGKIYIPPKMRPASVRKEQGLPPPKQQPTGDRNPNNTVRKPGRYADGGEADVGYLGSRKAPSPANPQVSNDPDYHDKTTSEQDTARRQQASEEEARGKAANLYADGGIAKHEHEKTAYDEGLPCLNPNCSSHGKSHPNCRCYGGMAEGGKVHNLRYCAHGRPHMPDCEYAKGGEVSQQGNDVRHAIKEKQRGNSGAAQQQMNFAKSEAKGRAEFERHIKPDIKGLKDGGKPEDADAMPDEDLRTQFERLEANDADKEPSDEQQNQDIQNESENADQFANPNNQSAQAAPLAPETQGLATPAPQQPQQFNRDGSGWQPLPEAPETQQQQGNYDPSKDLNPVQRFQNAAQYYDYTKNQIIQDGQNEGQAWLKDLQDGHIQPETYQSLFAKKDTPGKIGTLFGLLLSGAGSGLSHQSNAVMDMMKQTIDNDLHAQIRSKENAINYVRLGQQHEMNKANINNLNQEAHAKAIANAKVMMNWSLFHDQMKAIEKMPEGPAKQQAMAQMAVMNQAIQNDNFDIWSRMGSAAAAAHVMGLTGGGQGGGSEEAFQKRNKLMGSGMMGDVGKNVATMEAARHLPGVRGSASRDVDKSDADKYTAYTTLDNQLKDLMGAVNQYSNLKGNIDPRVVGPMAVKAHEAAALYNKTLDGLGMTEGRMDWLEKQIPGNPQAFMERLKGSKEKLQEVANNNNMRKNTMLSSYGFPAQTQGIKPKPGYTIEQHNGKNYYVPIKKK